VTVLEVIQRSSEFLARKGVDSPRLQIELLLAHVLQMPRMRLYLSFDRPLADRELETLRALVKRRAGREPLQHLVGSTNFCGFEITVTRDVLIPRPETELLAERAVEFLSGAESGSGAEGGAAGAVGRRVLDFGTGSGCLALVIAARCPAVSVCAFDRSAEALAVARQNAIRCAVEDRIQFQRGDHLKSLLAAGESRFDLIVSNPPYIPSGEIGALQPEVRDFDPREALDGGADGLDFYRMLAEGAGAWLRPLAPLMVELGAGQAGRVTELFQQSGWRIDRVEKDYGGHERILIARRLD